MITIILYRPVGQKELELIKESNYTAFPPRLPEQPIFYPVLNLKYAEEIAVKWNIKDKNSDYKGFVTKFEIDDSYILQFKSHIVGSSYHEEFWISAEELCEFNNNIIGKIEVVKSYG